MIDYLQIFSSIGATLGGTGIIWFIKTVSKAKSDLDIAFLKIRYLEDQMKEVKNAIH